MTNPFDDPTYDDGDDSLNGTIRYYLGANGLGSKFRHVELHAQEYFREHLEEILRSHVDLAARVVELEKKALEDRLALAQISSDYRYVARHSRINGAKENLEQFGIVDGKVQCVRGGGGPG